MATSDTQPNHPGVHHRTVRRLVILSVIIGIFGGLVGGYVLIRYFPVAIPAAKQALILQESSAAIDVANKVSPSVVSITSETAAANVFGRMQTQQGAGTGIVATDDGLIITNNHVIQGADNLLVYTSDGKQYKNAKVVARDPQNDIAFLKIDAKGLKPADLGDSNQVKVGTRVIAIGNALGQYQNTVTEGIISGIGRPVAAAGSQGGDIEQLQNLFQTDAAINPGNSGGPLVDMSGRVIGINTAVAGDAQGIGFAIPINLAKKELSSVQKEGKIVRPYLGVRYIGITKEFASQNQLPVTDGAYITGDQNGLAIFQGSPADKAGLKEGDIITKFKGTKLDGSHSLSALINEGNVGDKVTIIYLRDGKEQKTEATLGEAPSQS